MKTVGQLVEAIKQGGEDFEWYPTTTEIIRALQVHLKGVLEAKSRWGDGYIKRLLDIGCGNGSFLERFCNDEKFNSVKKFGIEKSNILAEQLPEDVILLGSDFTENTLIDKKVDMIFCNPPYSEYDAWAEKIILEGNADYIAMVIPVRWKDSERLKDALKRRNYQAEVIGTYDFNNAERRARATVDLIFISARKKGLDGKYYTQKANDPFDVWFESSFKIKANTEKQYSFSFKQQVENEIKNEIIVHGDTAETLVKFYNRDMEKLYNNYRKLEELDAELFSELKIDIPMLKESLKERLNGLKSVYWDMLFKRYDKVTSRLTSTGKKKVTQRLNDNTSIDFTISNIVQLTLWIIRHSNTLFDEQISEYFYSLCDTETIQRYKSNKRWTEDDWRYLKEELGKSYNHYHRAKEIREKATHIKLDYRIVIESWSNFDHSWGGRAFMEHSCIDFLNDTLVIAKNLGFDTDFTVPVKGEEIIHDNWRNFNINTKDGKLFANVKLYKNGNRHIKFCKEFMQKLNVEMARINNWIQDKSEAMAEMDIPADVIDQVWGSNLQIGIDSGRKLLGLPER